ncbi:MAG TPA: hypothetical protein VLY21_01460 [Nitrososphaerales archaeon]|nr:hypothetical protein [Nitrososphaerales archaeon]
MKIIVYLCAEHAEKVASKTIVPMTDDVLICQVPTCFKLATWKYFTTLAERAVSSTAERFPPADQGIRENPWAAGKRQVHSADEMAPAVDDGASPE